MSLHFGLWRWRIEAIEPPCGDRKCGEALEFADAKRAAEKRWAELWSAGIKRTKSEDRGSTRAAKARSKSA